jgi:hypothetical protein
MVAAKLANMGEGRPKKNSPNSDGISLEKAAEILSVSERQVADDSIVQACGFCVTSVANDGSPTVRRRKRRKFAALAR